MRRYWAWRRTDFLIALVALVGVVMTTVLIGLVIAVLLSVAFLLYRASRPYVAALGQMPGYRATFGDLLRHPDADADPRAAGRAPRRPAVLLQRERRPRRRSATCSGRAAPRRTGS